ncbi:multicopper oxidase family protein [Streptomyces sp. NPDC049813]|uniref:multicopper oxidase family protein n=1 Tax=Streptomyces sp. NPDC049813 TaxID=3365597 RepID=UPI00378F939B
MPTRRTVIRTAIAAAGSSAFTAGALTPVLLRRSEPATAQALVSTATAAKFTTPMPIPPVLSPYSTAGGIDKYRITTKAAQAEIVPGLMSDVLTYGGHFPGPVIKARSNRPVHVTHINKSSMATSAHLHGASVTQANDGSPMDPVEPGTSRTYKYPNKQSHASLWFHDHVHHMESEHVYRGLSGHYLLTDDVEQALPLPKGAYDIPISLRDADIDATGQLIYTMLDFPHRTTLLANGRAYPYVQVAARKYRFRLLNSSNLRFLTLRLADGGEIVQIGSDGGLLPKPFPTDTVSLSPAERADIVIDFSRYPVGTQLVLENTLLNGGPADGLGQVLRFDVVRTASDPSSVPATLRTLPPLPQPTAERTVVLELEETGLPDAKGTINGKVYDPDRIDTLIRHGASEVWTVTNPNRFSPHNLHLHLVQFRVLERDGQPPSPAESGLKDTVAVLPGETVKIQATFDTYKGVYLYHCHLLDHSAMGMMAQYKVA